VPTRSLASRQEVILADQARKKTAAAAAAAVGVAITLAVLSCFLFRTKLPLPSFIKLLKFNYFPIYKYVLFKKADLPLERWSVRRNR